MLREEALHCVIPPSLPSATLSLTLATLSPAILPPTPLASSPIKWYSISTASWTADKHILSIALPPNSGLPNQAHWHRKGDYLATVCPF